MGGARTTGVQSAVWREGLVMRRESEPSGAEERWRLASGAVARGRGRGRGRGRVSGSSESRGRLSHTWLLFNFPVGLRCIF